MTASSPAFLVGQATCSCYHRQGSESQSMSVGMQLGVLNTCSKLHACVCLRMMCLFTCTRIPSHTNMHTHQHTHAHMHPPAPAHQCSAHARTCAHAALTRTWTSLTRPYANASMPSTPYALSAFPFLPCRSSLLKCGRWIGTMRSTGENMAGCLSMAAAAAAAEAVAAACCRGSSGSLSA